MVVVVIIVIFFSFLFFNFCGVSLPLDLEEKILTID